jgi:hypothetical protein
MFFSEKISQISTISDISLILTAEKLKEAFKKKIVFIGTKNFLEC